MYFHLFLGCWHFDVWLIWYCEWIICLSVRPEQRKLNYEHKSKYLISWYYSTYGRENAGLLALTRIGSRRVVQISAGFMIFFSILGMPFNTYIYANQNVFCGFGSNCFSDNSTQENLEHYSHPFQHLSLLLCTASSLHMLVCSQRPYIHTDFFYATDHILTSIDLWMNANASGSVGLSFLQFCNLNSFRTKFILGFSVFLGLSIPQYFNEYTAITGRSPVHTGARWVCLFELSYTN